MAKILRVDLTSRISSWEEMPEPYKGLGGRGLTSAIVASDVPPKADPLGPENVVVFAPGIIAGTSLPNSGRLSVGGKSPLTGTIKESNSGGTAARKLARLGIAALVLRGKSADPVTITITKEGAAFRPATSLGGMGNYAAVERLKAEFPGTGLITIGPAGEKMLTAAAAMEAGRIPWGDGARVLELLESIRRDDPLGLLLGNGCAVTGKTLGAARVPVVKGQALSAYDPRVLKGTGVPYATAPMGDDHTCGNALPSPANPGYDPGSPSGQNQVSEFLQSFFASIDTLGMCLFASIPILESPDLQRELTRAVAAKLGVELPDGYLQELGRGVVVAERAFNRLAGFGPGDDRLPGFLRKETLSPGGNVWDVPDEDLDKMLT
ncbi:MAG: aldehyde ferredoxin oxidoreductase N-terminal domain-containing protein [Candidatus Deferrimicrobium sp.]